jgi:hypothetical protein
VREQRDLLAQEFRGGNVVVPGQRPDRDVRALVGDVRQVGDAADVDEHRGRREPQLHQRQQRMAAGQVLGVLAGLRRQGQRLVHGRRALVGKGGWDHLLASAADSAAFTMLW